MLSNDAWPVDVFWRATEPTTLPGVTANVSSTPRSVPSDGQPKPVLTLNRVEECAFTVPGVPALAPTLLTRQLTEYGASLLDVLFKVTEDDTPKPRSFQRRPLSAPDHCG